MSTWALIAGGGMLVFIGMVVGILIIALCCTSQNSNLDSLETENRILRERLNAVADAVDREWRQTMAKAQEPRTEPPIPAPWTWPYRGTGQPPQGEETP